VLGDMDVLIADSPKLHFRRPDVVVYRYIDDDRGRWGRMPIADSITTDIRDKHAEYAAAGIPHHWIVRMTDNDGPAISVERLLLTDEEPDGEFDLVDPARADADLAAYHASVDRARAAVEDHGLDDLASGSGRPTSLRWVFQHMIEEYARHNGHADLLRERIDGVTGD
jgi:hypothetical protein